MISKSAVEYLAILTLNKGQKFRRRQKGKTSKMKMTSKRKIKYFIKDSTTFFHLSILSSSLLLTLILASQTLSLLAYPKAQTLTQGSQSEISVPKKIQQDTSTTQTPVTISEQLSHSGLCAMKASCKQKNRRRDLDVGPELSKHLCYCDQSCVMYDDCCPDSLYSQAIDERIKFGLDNLERIRSEWHCHKVNSIFGDVLLRASCPTNWLTKQTDTDSAQLIKRRCEYVKDRGKQNQNQKQNQQQQHSISDLEKEIELDDPVGMMMPITDLSSGITYANSYCLRCNIFSMIPSIPTTTTTTTPKPGLKSKANIFNQATKLIYWSPLLECSYNLENDEKNTLIDLINSNKGRVLQYSRRMNRWILSVDDKQVNNNETASRTTIANQPKTSTSTALKPENDRVCSITPTIPESVEHIIRYCKSDVIHKCPDEASQPYTDRLKQVARKSLTKERARVECQFGHQSLAFGSSGDTIYFNPACATCNDERQITCEPKLGKNLLEPLLRKIIHQNKSKQQQNGTDRVIFSPPTTSDDSASESEFEPDQNIFGVSGRGGSQQIGNTVSGSFSVLMDLYGSSQGDEQVGSVHQCPDAENQVYDPFLLTCRDIICGLNHQYVDGKCISLSAALKDNLVEKFEPAMAYITTICLSVSIAGLAIYLLLYCLSMFDLRHLVVDLKQSGQGQNSFNKDEKSKRESRGSNEMYSAGGSTNSGASRSQSLSSRGVACLASSLLAAYLLFIMGHQRVSLQQTSPNSAPWPTSTTKEINSEQVSKYKSYASISCFVIAAGTYYCFLVAFNWMFLLSYDIWRTLKLATCHLRAPALHSQSKRFISYMLFALVGSGIVVGLSIFVDLIPLSCEQQQQQQQQHHDSQLGIGNISLPKQQQAISDCLDKNPEFFDISRFVHNYRPRFGQQVGSCWFSNRRALALFFGLPVTFIMILNLLFFLHSSFMVIKTSSRSSRHLTSTSTSRFFNNNSTITTNTSQKAPSSPKLISIISHVDSLASSNCSTDSSASCQDYAHQNSLTTNSMISVQTLQSHLSHGSDDAGRDEDSITQGGARESFKPSTKMLEGSETNQMDVSNTNSFATERNHANFSDKDINSSKRKLETTESSSSLTNQSIGASSITASLAHKCDAHLQSLSSAMGSVIKDYRLYCRLSTIMGLTWLTGIMASVVDQSEVLWYLFVVLNTLQGLFIFIAFGCKRSKLANLEILLNYARFKFKQGRERCDKKENKAQKENQQKDPL